jgi:Flp pilus assembly protein TadG
MIRLSRRGRFRGQSLVEFAITLPILALLLAGTLELGRGYTFAVATTDTARDAARYLAGKTSTTNGPGLPAMCGTDFTAPVPGQAVVAVFCGTTSNCAGATGTLYQSEVDVYVYYGFSDLNLLGGGITIAGSSRATTSW